MNVTRIGTKEDDELIFKIEDSHGGSITMTTTELTATMEKMARMVMIAALEEM